MTFYGEPMIHPQPKAKSGVPAVGGLKFSMAQKKDRKSASWGTKFNPWTDDFFFNFEGGFFRFNIINIIQMI